MRPERLTAFTGGVVAIIITIMVLELKAPHDEGVAALIQLAPVFLGYVLSFVYVAIYWNNHHHLLYACRQVNGSILWANMHLLFWLSLIPFATTWTGENHFAATPTAFYGVILLMPALSKAFRLCRKFLSWVGWGYDRRKWGRRTIGMIDFKGSHFERDVTGGRGPRNTNVRTHRSE